MHRVTPGSVDEALYLVRYIYIPPVAATIPEAASDSSAVQGPAPAAESIATQQLPPKRPDPVSYTHLTLPTTPYV